MTAFLRLAHFLPLCKTSNMVFVCPLLVGFVVQGYTVLALFFSVSQAFSSRQCSEQTVLEIIWRHSALQIIFMEDPSERRI